MALMLRICRFLCVLEVIGTMLSGFAVAYESRTQRSSYLSQEQPKSQSSQRQNSDQKRQTDSTNFEGFIRDWADDEEDYLTFMRELTERKIKSLRTLEEFAMSSSWDTLLGSFGYLSPLRVKLELWHKEYLPTTDPVKQEELREHAAIQLGFPVSASSDYASDHSVDRLRLDFSNSHGSHAWCAGFLNADQWVQVSSSDVVTWTAVETQGRGDHGHWVMSYTVQCSSDGKTWDDVDEGRLFPGNRDSVSKVKHMFRKPAKGRTLRVRPVTWNGHICMRMEAYFEA
eukprot:TRINITY_DN18488_c0_g1_i1.p1 TRINITY_DN18488_c0_g1~~TRINITY_DN18488_c0_g1_i1.p1  ORF type:complete len:285 (-),score=40.51 TRINITY_DN18488_c0_g1_i1:45-899(-)